MSTLTEAKISEQLRLLVKIYLINGIKEPSSLYVSDHMHFLSLLARMLRMLNGRYIFLVDEKSVKQLKKIVSISLLNCISV